jgi:clan AA aspartic protease
MITGAVNTRREAVVRLRVQGTDGREQEIEAIVDTGFNGTIALPSALVSWLGLPFRGRGRALLADGTETLFDVHEGAVVWDGRLRRVLVDAVDSDPLIGMGVLYGCRLTIQVEEDGSVIIEAL